MPIELKEALLVCANTCLIAKEAELAQGAVVNNKDIPVCMLSNDMVMPNMKDWDENAETNINVNLSEYDKKCV